MQTLKSGSGGVYALYVRNKHKHDEALVVHNVVLQQFLSRRVDQGILLPQRMCVKSFCVPKLNVLCRNPCPESFSFCPSWG